ncbi:DNA repair and recombination protein RAD54B-like isoform X1 [Mya arenaria]|uniref:DNA repair and recombination protein RAD54B-like isoform X1 n=1 Tax=Mya arenaria TaxID=6604 RepID=UPI0022E45C92|nr:DNA repair and recombination protein RAD54B-like isoform X1 [Mya arenaria]
MRRSAAPSQAGNRPKFVAPLLGNRTASLTETDRTDRKPVKQTHVLKRIFPNPELDSTDKIADVTCIERAEEVDPVVKKPRFQAPIAGSRPSVTLPPASSSARVSAHVEAKRTGFTAPVVSNKNDNKGPGDSENATPEEASSQCGYFNVVWCKRSNKKHKKWEGDAILVTSGRSVTLYDTEGKEIGKSSGYKSTELATLKEDETLPIGGKEIQVMSILKEAAFKSGKCFLGSTGSTSGPAPSLSTAPARTANKQFSRPQILGSMPPETRPQEPTLVKPRHDPTAPGALVLPRPSQTHQWECNKSGVAVVDVVVDPYLASNLRPHQREGVTFLYSCVMGFRNFSGCGAILADDMGLGKTLQCISLIWTMLKQGPYGGKPVAKKILVVTPGSLVKNWHAEFKKWLGFERLQVYAVSADKKVEEFTKTSIYPVLIISYEMFVRMFDLLQKLTFDLIVCDEGHRLKNTAIKTTSLLSSLSCVRRVVLTGTPIQNDLQEFFSIVEFCNPGVLGTSSGFKRVYEDPIVSSRQPGATPAQVALGEERGAELARMTQMFVLRRTQEINNKYLPPKKEIVLFCRPSPLQLSLYHQLLRSQLVRSCLSGCLAGSPHLVCIGALKQLCNHPGLIYQKALKAQRDKDELENAETSVYDGLLELFPDDFKPDRRLEEHSGKLTVLSALLHCIHTSDMLEKIVVVSNHTKTLDLIECLCKGTGYGYLRLDGQTPTARRQELVTRFNSKHSQEFIFLLSSKAGGVGLNLIGASRLVLYDIDWNPANDLQAMARVWRDGQRHAVHIYRLLTTGSIEEKVYQRQISKQGLSGAVMDARDKGKSDVQFSLKDLRDLFTINLTTDCDTHDLLSCECGGSGQKVENPVSVAEQRLCQLGAPARASRKRNVGMDELLQWKHHTADVLGLHKAWYLEDARDAVSFVFYSEVKASS